MKFGDMYTRAAQSVDFKLVLTEGQKVLIESTKNMRPQSIEKFFDMTVVFFVVNKDKIVVEVL